MNGKNPENIRPDIEGLAHDMRSPLSVIKGFLETIAVASGEEMDFYAAAQNSLEKLVGIAERLRWAKDQRKFLKYDLASFIKSAVEEINFVSREKGIKVLYAGPKNLSCVMCKDEMERVLINLVTNALDASMPGGEVLVGLCVRKGAIVIDVADYGSGIKSEILPHIFDRGFTYGKPGGTGLGLDVCRKIIADHGGSINVKSEVGLGTVFTVSIPNASFMRESGQVHFQDIAPACSYCLCPSFVREDTLD